MAAKKKSTLGPQVRKLLEQALLEALRRHISGKSQSARAKKKAPARKKKASKKKVTKKTAVRRRKRRTSKAA
jgi:hypothetical protein